MAPKALPFSMWSNLSSFVIQISVPVQLEASNSQWSLLFQVKSQKTHFKMQVLHSRGAESSEPWLNLSKKNREWHWREGQRSSDVNRV